MKAILVEDELYMQKAFARMSKNVENFELIEIFDNAKDAMQYAENHSFDAAFIDIYMPETNGFALAAMLQKSKPWVKLVFVSALVEAFQAQGFEDVELLLKPYTKEQLESVIDKLQD